MTAAPNAAAPHGSQAHQGFDPWIIWVTFRQCWAWAVPTGLVFAGIAAFAVLQSFTPTYEATHLMEANQDFVVFKGVLPLNRSSRNVARTEKQLIYNSIVLDSVLAIPGTREVPSLSDPESAETNLRKNLSVGNAGTDTLLTISYRDEDPDAAAYVANVVADAYLSKRNEFDQTRSKNLERWLSPEIQRWRGEVESRQRRVEELSGKTAGYAVSDSNRPSPSDVSLIEKLRAEKADLEVERAVMEASLAMDESEDAQWKLELPEVPAAEELKVDAIEPTESDIENFIARDPAVKEARRLQDYYKQQMFNMEEKDLVRINREHYESLQEKRDEQTAAVAKAEKAARGNAVEELQRIAEEDRLAKKQQLRQELLNDQKQQITQREKQRAEQVRKLRDVSARLEVINGQYEEARRELEQFGGDAAALQFAQHDLSVAVSVMEKLLDRQAAIQTEQRRDGSIRSLAEATPARRPVESVPMKKIFAASGGAFFLPFILGLLWEMKVQRISDTSKLESRDLVPVVGEVSKLPAGNRTGRSQRVFEESIDSLRANLFLSKATAGARSYAITSSMSGEGKSSVASQLAVSIAKATGETVLLIDADLRSPDQHEIFGLELTPGLSKVLSGEIELEEAVDKSLGDLVHVVPAGKLIENPHRLLSTSALRETIDQAMQSYRHVIVDTAPVLSAGETLAVTCSVDATLLCMMRDVSRVENVSRTTRRLEAAGANLVGTVFSGVPAREYAYRYGDYRYAHAVEA